MSKNLFGGQITEQDAIKEMLKAQKMTQKELAKRMKRSPQSLSRTLNAEFKGGMRIELLCWILRCMNCEMVLRPRVRRVGHLDEWKIR